MTKINIDDMEPILRFGEDFPDGRLTANPDRVHKNISIRDAVEKVKQLERPLTDQELVVYIKSIEYHGYTGSVEFSKERQIFYGQFLDIENLIPYEGDNLDVLCEDFADAVNRLRAID